MFSVQLNWAEPCKPCTPEEFERIASCPALKRRMARCREIGDLLNGPQLFEQTEEQKKALETEYNRLKKKSAAFVFQANFPGQKREQSDAHLTGLYMADFDHVNVNATLRQWAAIFGVAPQDRAQLWQKMNQEMGVLLVHITPSNWGLRVVAKTRMEGNLAWNQQCMARALDTKVDEACKDASRCSFAVSWNEILYINPQIFEYENKDYEARYGAQYRTGGSASVGFDNGVSPAGAVVPDGSTAQADTVAGGPAVAPAAPLGGGTGLDGAEAEVLTYGGIPFAEITAEWWRQNGGEPREGERNVKLQKLASNLRYICENNPDTLLRVMPTYGLPEAEMRSLVQRACGYKFFSDIPVKMRMVLNALHSVELPDGQPSDELLNRLLVKYGQRLKGLRMPAVLKAVMGGVDPNLRVGALMASLPMFYTLLSRVRFRHYDGTECRLSGMTFIVGPAASGKGFIKELDAILMECLRAEDKGARELEETYQQSKELNKNKKEQMKRPKPCIRIVPCQVSNTKLADRMRNAYDPELDLHLHCYTMETELATVLRASKGGSWIEKSDLYCKAFHNELWGMDYANDQAINGEVQVNLNLVVSGTEDAFDRLIPTATILSGLPTRIMYFPMPEMRFQMLDLKHTTRSEAQKAELREAAYALSHAGGWVDAAPLTRAMYQWCARMANHASLEDDVELDDLRKRTPLIGVRAGIIYAILQQWRSYVQGRPLKIGADAIRFAQFVADFSLTMQYAKFASRMKEQKAKACQYRGARSEIGHNAELYNRLKMRFANANLTAEGLSASSVSHILRRWCEKGFVRKLRQGYYEKIVKEV